jgi:hypothetical protein
MKLYSLIVALVLAGGANAAPTFSTPGIGVKNGVVTGSARATVTASKQAAVAVAIDSHARWLDATGTPLVLGYFENGLAFSELEYVASWTDRNYVMSKPTTITLSITGYAPEATSWLAFTPPLGAVTLEVWWVARSEAFADGVWYNGPKVSTKKYAYTLK